jgi:glycosyltransferase involved in cell wall biosynthesis
VLISVIVSTYNRPDALSLVLQSLNQQTDTNFEIVVADDGSKDETRQLIDALIQNFSQPLTHVWHEDLGFRLAAIRNLAVKHCRGSYFIFLDGDCIVQPDFIARHRCLSEDAHMVTGSRVLLNEKFTQSLIAQQVWDISGFRRHLLLKRLNGSVNKFLAFYIKFCQSSVRYYSGFKWRGIKGCNFACWRQDFEFVGGYDETFEGWGHEDADMVFRLHSAGIKRKSGSFATEVLHLYHPENNRSQAEQNKSKLLERIRRAA